ncbi:hypothetical protein LSTR_LSTR007658 [Laodelphax striatellus]|uniref:Trafficking protein particle complex subunit 2-like protein n=1 Tax=Laodelphax striatellus TaxID=195883 RepID=A0A482WII9_LAOST|nr:hypothetical protein LSTR_LSTR007658 [Laodelphax striatellus]
MAVCIAVIGKENSPKFIRCLDQNEEINFHFKMFRKLHLAYTDTICNPFYVPGEMIASKKFEAVVESIMNGQ